MIKATRLTKARHTSRRSITLKWFSICAFCAVLSACSSQPKDPSFVGPGEFNAQEAAKTRVSLGLTYLKNGNFSQAKFNLDKALEFAPRSGEANYAMAFYYQQVEEVARAEEYYQTALSYSRNDPDVLNSYGAFLCKQGNYEKAKEFFLQAVNDKSYISTAETYENIALCAQNQGLKQEAIGYLENALSHQPTRASSLLYIAQIYTELGQWEDAKKALWKHERNAQVSADSLWLSYQIAQGENNLKTATEYADLLRSLYPGHNYTKTALAQLGKFRPSMAVTLKQRPSPSFDTPNAVAPRPPIVQDTTPQAAEPAPTEPTVIEPAPKGASTNEITANNDVTQENQKALKSIPKVTEDDYHVVQLDENLYRISLKYNVKMEKLLEWNNLNNASNIRTGSKLRVRDPNINE